MKSSRKRRKKRKTSKSVKKKVKRLVSKKYKPMTLLDTYRLSYKPLFSVTRKKILRQDCDFFKIPNEVVAIIHTFIDFYSILRFSLTCSRYYLLLTSPYIRRTIFENDPIVDSWKSQDGSFFCNNWRYEKTCRRFSRKLRPIIDPRCKELYYVIVNHKDFARSYVLQPELFRLQCRAHIYDTVQHEYVDKLIINENQKLTFRRLYEIIEEPYGHIQAWKDYTKAPFFEIEVQLKKGNGLCAYRGKKRDIDNGTIVVNNMKKTISIRCYVDGLVFVDKRKKIKYGDKLFGRRKMK